MSFKHSSSSDTQLGERSLSREEIELDSEIAVGLIPRDTQTETLARALLRAKQSDYAPLLVNTSAVGTEAIGFAQQLNIPIVDPLTELDSVSVYENTLGIIAQTAGAEQIIVHDHLADPIDYERTERTRKKDDAFVISAVPESTPESTPEVVAAIPAYNEANTIAEVIKETTPYVDEVVVIDDGSDDDTVAVADAAGATVIEHGTNEGYGTALKTAFTMAADRDIDRLVILDGDGQHEPEDIPRLFERLDETDSEIAIGSRLADDGETDIPVYRRIGLGVVNVLTNLSMGITNRRQWVQDTQSGFRAYEQSAIESLAADPSIGSDMDASTDILYHSHKHEYNIEEVGTTIYYDVEEGSSQNPLSHGIRLVINILNTVERERPIAFVGLPGFLLAIFGLTLGYLAFSNFLSTGSFPLGLALGSSVIFLAGLFFGLTAVVLHALKQYLQKGEGYEHRYIHTSENGRYP